MSSKLVIETISPGLRKIAVPSPTIPPATHTNSWILGADGDCVIIDPAAHQSDVQKEHIALLEALKPKAIVLTHHHRDHIAGAAALQSHFNLPIWAHKNNAPLIRLRIDRALEEAEILSFGTRKWRVLFTPGHAPGHIALFDSENGDCICGDLVAGVGTIVLNPPEGDLGLYLASLKRLQDEGVQILHPAHGPSIDPARPYLQHYIDHRNMRTGQILDCLSKTPVSVLHIAEQIYPQHVGTPIIGIAGRQIYCHLEWLTLEGQAFESELGWIRR